MADKKEVILDCAPFEYTLSVIGGKWKMIIMLWIFENEIMRYGELKKSINGLTHKVLTTQLKELEADHIIIRTAYEEIPPRVEYTLSEKGKSFMPIVQAMVRWGCEYYVEPNALEKKSG